MAEKNTTVLIGNPPPRASDVRIVRSEVHVEANREKSRAGRQVRKSEVRGGESHATGDQMNAETLRRNRKIERLERELLELRNAQGGQNQQRSGRQRSRSRSGSCESSHHFPRRSGKDHKTQKGSRRSKSIEQTRKTSPMHKSERKDHNPVWRQLQQISQSPFSSKIEQARFPTKFTPLNLVSYNGKTDPVAHLSHYRQSLAHHNRNDALMCRIFPSSLGEVALRWFDRLEHGSIHSWKELSEAFTNRFITNSRKPKEVDSLMALTMKLGESLKSYSTRYWETYNEINSCGEDIAVRQFRFSLSVGSKLRQSLTKKPPPTMTDLMSKIEQHVRVEEDGPQSQKQTDVSTPAPKKPDQADSSRAPRKSKQSEPITKGSFEAVNTTFKEPIFKILPQIKDKPYFVWPPKMGGDPAFRESKPFCAYHKENGHLTENYRAYKGFLEKLVQDGHLCQFVDNSKGKQQQYHTPKSKNPIGIIEVIHSHARASELRAETREAAHLREVFHIDEGVTPAPKKLRKESTEEIVFTDHDLEGVQLPHSDALVVTMRVVNFDVKRILIDPGSSAEIMYDSLFKGLGFKHEDLDRKVDPL